MNKEIKGIVIFGVKVLISGIVIFILLSFWGNQKVYDLLFILSPNSDNYYTRFINNNNFYCEGNKVVLLDDIFKYGLNNKYETNLENINDYGNKKIYSLKSNFNLTTINDLHTFIFDNKLYCEGDKLFWGKVPGVLEGFYCGEKEGVEIKQEKPLNECN